MAYYSAEDIFCITTHFRFGCSGKEVHNEAIEVFHKIC